MEEAGEEVVVAVVGVDSNYADTWTSSPLRILKVNLVQRVLFIKSLVTTSTRLRAIFFSRKRTLLLESILESSVWLQRVLGVTNICMI